jgi:hypothetical protein
VSSMPGKEDMGVSIMGKLFSSDSHCNSVCLL